MVNLIDLLVFVILILSFVYTIDYFTKRKINIGYYIISIVILGSAYFFRGYFYNDILAFVILLSLMYLICFFLFKMDIYESLFIIVFFGTNYLWIKSAVLGLMSLYIVKNMYQLLLVPRFYYISSIAVNVVFVVILLGFYKRVSVKKITSFINCKGQLKFVVGVHCALLVFLMYSQYNLYFNLDLIWFSLFQVLTSIMVIAVYLLILGYGIKVSCLLEEQLIKERSMNKLEEQMSQYKYYESIHKRLNTFKTSYRDMILTTNYLLEKKDIKKAKDVLDEKGSHLLDELPVIKEYSNLVELNSLLHSSEVMCHERQVSFDGIAAIPKTIKVDEKSLYTVVSILLENALKATCKCDQNRFIKINTKQANGWLTLSISNSYDEEIVYNNGIPKNTSYQSEIKTSGLNYVVNEVETSKGMIRFDSKEHVLTVSVLYQY